MRKRPLGDHSLPPPPPPLCVQEGLIQLSERIRKLLKESDVSVNSKPDHPPGQPPEIRTFYLPLGSGFPSSVLSGGLPGGGGIKSKEKFDNFEKSAIFALSLKQMSSSSFHMFKYARSEQYDLTGGPTYLLIISWRSGYCYLKKRECDLNQSKDDCFLKRVAKNNN